MSEHFDVVNERDEIIGRATREECHRNPNLVHRGIYVIVINEQEKLLISKRSMKKDTMPGRWEFIGGHNDVGEDYKDAAMRELKEELGISTPIEKISKLKLSSDEETEIDVVFVSRINDSTKIEFSRDEIDEIKFIDVDELREELSRNPEKFISWLPFVFDEYLKYIDK